VGLQYGMRTNVTLVFALTAGFLGGLASRYWSPAPVYAQATSAAEIRARKFVLIDEKGTARGVFGLETNGSPTVEITDGKGRVYAARWWSAQSGELFHTLLPAPRKTTLLP
jgi:hypothetical protein